MSPPHESTQTIRVERNLASTDLVDYLTSPECVQRTFGSLVVVDLHERHSPPATPSLSLLTFCNKSSA